ncbi:hypothetical protein PI124_g562 [Phytophthora idaei]|nr:hypothetical protein PI125_g9871 [Phytophthora idaei]KAG3152324.1 hypothetical protein PI126_g10572 [Phytophthora idaei]KAG3254928.1 hypothetical protein PI124_g562 [Phytophthora idaei]
MECPSKCPDFNIIENVWGLLAGRVYANGRQFNIRAELKACINAEWARIEPDYIKKLVKSVPKRLHLAMALKGATMIY